MPTKTTKLYRGELKKLVPLALILILCLATAPLYTPAHAQEQIELTAYDWPEKVVIGREYTFTIEASNPGIDDMTFTVVNITYLGTLPEGVTLSIGMISIRSVSNWSWSWVTPDLGTDTGGDYRDDTTGAIIAQPWPEGGDPYTTGVQGGWVRYYIDGNSICIIIGPGQVPQPSEKSTISFTVNDVDPVSGDPNPVPEGVWSFEVKTVEANETTNDGGTYYKLTNNVLSNVIKLSTEVVRPASISPNLVKGGTYWFDITVENMVSESSIYNVTIQYPFDFNDVVPPSGWTIDSHDTTKKVVVFKAAGPGISPGESATFKFKMTTPTEETGVHNWIVTATDTAQKEFKVVLQVTVDNTPPEVEAIVPAPAVDYYSVGAGNYIWLNITVVDDVKAQPNVYVNDSRFELIKVEYEEDTGYIFSFANKTAIPDGRLAVWFNVTDYVGNWKQIEGAPEGFPDKISAYAITTVDNTPPVIIITVYKSNETKPLPQPVESGPFYVSKGENAIDINITVIDYAIDNAYTGVYINGTPQTVEFTSTGKSVDGVPVYEALIDDYTISADDVRWEIFVNVTDTASPRNHTSAVEQVVMRDLEGPYELGFTDAEPISGGLIVRGLYAKDLVGVYQYVINVNGTLKTITVTEASLTSTEWTTDEGYGAVNGTLVLNLPEYAGKFVNITVKAFDYGDNPSEEVVLYVGTIPEGEYYPIELEKGWNLVSLPLIPANESIEAVLSLALNQKIVLVYAYDAETGEWLSYNAKLGIGDLTAMCDGVGYWVYASEPDVLVVQGREMPPPPSLPPTYHLVKGWNLVGFKSTTEMSAAEYLSSLEGDSYWSYLWVWNAENQEWVLVNVGEDGLRPGQAFWIYMYEEQDLLPPSSSSAPHDGE